MIERVWNTLLVFKTFVRQWSSFLSFYNNKIKMWTFTTHKQTMFGTLLFLPLSFWSWPFNIPFMISNLCEVVLRISSVFSCNLNCYYLSMYVLLNSLRHTVDEKARDSNPPPHLFFVELKENCWLHLNHIFQLLKRRIVDNFWKWCF